MTPSTETAIRSMNELSMLDSELLNSEEFPSIDTLYNSVRTTFKSIKKMKATMYRISIMDAESFEEKRFNVSKKEENAKRLARNARRNGYATRIQKMEE
jgi:hypothetical protein